MKPDIYTITAFGVVHEDGKVGTWYHDKWEGTHLDIYPDKEYAEQMSNSVGDKIVPVVIVSMKKWNKIYETIGDLLS